jgi:hypothetical protein
MEFSGVYWTHEELFGDRMTEEQLIGALKSFAVEDCVEALSRLSCMVEGSSIIDPARQLRILRRVGPGDDFADAVRHLVDVTGGKSPRAFFFPQQTQHLMRLVLRYCDRRPRDYFDGGRLTGHFVKVVFGVTDLMEPEMPEATLQEGLAFILRQSGLHGSERMYLLIRYYDLLVRRWPQVHGAGAGFDPGAAFERHTGVTLEDFFKVGFMIYTRFLSHVDLENEPVGFALDPPRYFAEALVPQPIWKTVVDMLCASPAELCRRLDEEDDCYGPTTYRAHSFDRRPLVRFDNGWVVPCSFAALERAVTEGAFWILADAAEAEGRRREDFTSPFGKVFESFAQTALERIAALEAAPPAVYRDFAYGPKRSRALSSDMTFVYEREAIFFEVATGRLNVATQTRGDTTAFVHDVRRLILKKARQLRLRYNDFTLFGTLKFDGIGRERIQIVWPVIVLIEGFPLMPPILGEVERRVRAEGWPKGAPRITFINADELGALEKLVEDGWTTIEIVRKWKREAPDLSMSNWLSRAPEFAGDVGHATWHQRAFDELQDHIVRDVLGPEAAEHIRELAASLTRQDERGATPQPDKPDGPET